MSRSRRAAPAMPKRSRSSTTRAKSRYEKLLDVFWRNIDPFVKDRQFCDSGDMYRTGIFFHTPEQRQLAEASKKTVESARFDPRMIQTEIIAGEHILQGRGLSPGLLHQESAQATISIAGIADAISGSRRSGARRQEQLGGSATCIGVDATMRSEAGGCDGGSAILLGGALACSTGGPGWTHARTPRKPSRSSRATTNGEKSADAHAVSCAARARHRAAGTRARSTRRNAKASFACAGCDLPLFASETKYRKRHRLAELLPAAAERGRHRRRSLAVHAAHRSALPPLRRPSRSCLR